MYIYADIILKVLYSGIKLYKASSPSLGGGEGVGLNLGDNNFENTLP